jgi:serine/threonine protein kinase
MDYAEGIILRNYLGGNFSSLNWQDKYRLAFQLSSAIEYIHEKGIVHKDLHSNNVFIQQDSIKLAGSGLIKRIENTDQDSFNTIPYIDPQVINSSGGEKYKLNKKSDVYSVGVLFWELSSGKKPFADKEHNSSLAIKIAQGLRESVVEGTPEEYSNLYASE